MCRYCVETFNHIFTCSKSKDIVVDIRQKSQRLLLQLMYDHANIKVESTYLFRLPDIWTLDYRNLDMLTFIDIIKGFVPRILSDKIHAKVKHQEMTSLIISNFMNFIYTDICSRVWNVRCQAQINIEKGLGITNRMKKQKNNSRNRLPNIVVDRNLYSSSLTNRQLGVLNSVRLGGFWAGFTRRVNQFLRFAPCLRWLDLNTFSGP